MPDTRTKREKLQDMAERGTPAEQEAARRALDRLPPDPVEVVAEPASTIHAGGISPFPED